MSSRDDRVKIIKAIEEKLNSKLICYVTSDRPGFSGQIAPDVIPIIHDHILSLITSGTKNIDLFIYSRGGISDVPWALVSMFREYTDGGTFRVLIPFRAHSAATVIALGADDIIMTKKAELGPIDITTNGIYNPKDEITHQILPVEVEDVMGYFSLLNKIGCERPEEKMRGFELIASCVSPLALGNVDRLLDQTKLVAFCLLSTRKNPLTDDENREIIKKLSQEVYSHNHAISRTEAKKYIGLSQVKNAEELDIYNEMWALYEEYKKYFDLENPFLPEEILVAKSSDKQTWTDLKIACIESEIQFNYFKQDLTVRRLIEVPPTVTLNLQNMNLPQINLPQLGCGVTPEQINALVANVTNSVIQKTLNEAAQEATKQFIALLPSKGFERIVFNSAWIKEN